MDDNSKRSNKKHLVLMLLLIFVLIGVVFGVTYSVFVYGKAGSKNNTVSTSSIIFTYDETTNGIALDDVMPMSDEVGKKLEKNEKTAGYFDFNVGYTASSSRTVNYEIYATTIDSSNALDSKYVKVYLTDQNDKPINDTEKVGTYSELADAESDSKSKRLYYGSFSKTDSKKFRLRMWVSKDYEVTNESKTFKIKVKVNATES